MIKIKKLLDRKDLFLFGTIKEGGAIATKEDYKNGIVSFAHLYPNGKVNRYGEEIADIKDLEFGDEQPDPIPDIGAFMNLFDSFFGGSSWEED